MSVLSRDFSTREKVILLILLLFLVGFAYYQFVDKPVRESLAAAEAETEKLQTELTSVRNRIATLQRMRDEIDDVTSGGLNSYMPSYNNSREELRLLNDILSRTTQYTITFTGLTRSGDQIRRNFTLQFTASDYDVMRAVIGDLTGSEMRCLIGDLRCSLVTDRYRDWVDGVISVNCSAVFYETMVGGEPDAGLPAA